jgi:hypothetical protein
MKISVLTCFILFSQIVFSQEIPPDLLRKMEKAGQQKNLNDTLYTYDLSAGKGKLTFTNGKTARFTSVKLKRDSVFYDQTDKIIHKIPLSEVSVVTEIHKHRGQNALIGSTVGMFTGLVAGLLAYPEDNTLITLVQLIFQGEDIDSPKLSPKAIPMILGTTVAGALIGSLITSKKDQEVIYRKNDVTVSFVPEISASPDIHRGYMLTARIRF